MRWDGTRIGIAATVAAVLFALIYPAVAPTWCAPNHCFPVNEYGDWLAGFAQPIALAWLVAGFWLQRQELTLQRKELAETREELARQASATISTDLTAKRNLFTAVRSEIFSQLDETLPATVTWLEEHNWWRHNEEPLVRAVSINLANALRHTDRNSPPYEFLLSLEFNDRSEHFCRTFEALLTLAQEADGQGQLFTDLIRATPYFGFYRQLRLVLANGTGLHAAARGARPGDFILREWNGVSLGR